MQIREQGKKVQLIRSPYDSEKKRCVQKLAHSFPRAWIYTSADLDKYLSAEQIDDLSDDEKQELTAWLSARTDKDTASKMENAISFAGDRINAAADAILSDVKVEEKLAIHMWEAMDKLSKALKKAGFKKPSVKAAQANNADQSSLTL